MFWKNYVFSLRMLGCVVFFQRFPIFQHSMKFPAILYGLNDLLSEVLMHVEAAVSHLYFHQLPRLLLLNLVELLSLPTRQDTLQTSNIHFYSPIPSHSWNESSDTDVDVNLIS